MTYQIYTGTVGIISFVWYSFLPYEGCRCSPVSLTCLLLARGGEEK
jgi:hypothetical protein